MYRQMITKFSRMGRLLHFLTHGAPLARFARESSANNHVRSSCNETVSEIKDVLFIYKRCILTEDCVVIIR